MAAGFELFSHRTRLMGSKIVLLGLFNGQKIMGANAEEACNLVVDRGGNNLKTSNDDTVRNERAKRASCSNTRRAPLEPFEHSVGATTRREV